MNVKKTLQCIGKYVLSYLIIAICLTGLLVLAALIPRSSIENNVRKSAEYLGNRDVYEIKVKGNNASWIDRYADSILIGIAYQYDNEKPLESVMWSAYYCDFTVDENINLLTAVRENKEANKQYMRYWHGSNVVVRTLHLFLSIKGIYILNAILLAILLGVLIYLLVRNKAYIPAVGLVAGLVATSSWFVPLSLEYTWTFYIMLVMSIIMVVRETGGTIRNDNRKANKDGSNSGNNKDNHRYVNGGKNLGTAFMICGMVTCFMDFLTTEILTLLVPLLIVLYFRRSSTERQGERYTGNVRSLKGSTGGFDDKADNGVFGWKKAAVPVLTWGIGYAGMWLTKWLMAAAVLGRDVTPYVKENLKERFGGKLSFDLGLWDYLKGAVTRNFRILLPWSFGGFGIVAVLLICFAAVYLCYVYRKESIRGKYILMCAVIAVIPCVRYLILHNHSFLHYFFTFRSQIALIMAVVLIVGEIIDFDDLLQRSGRKKRTAGKKKTGRR